MRSIRCKIQVASISVSSFVRHYQYMIIVWLLERQEFKSAALVPARTECGGRSQGHRARCPRWPQVSRRPWTCSAGSTGLWERPRRKLALRSNESARENSASASCPASHASSRLRIRSMRARSAFGETTARGSLGRYADRRGISKEQLLKGGAEPTTPSKPPAWMT